MADTLTVGSSFASDIRMEAPEPKKGEDREPDIVLNGAVGQREGITSAVSAKRLRAWVRSNPEHPAVTGGLLREVVGVGQSPSAPSPFAFDPADAVADAAIPDPKK